MRPRPLGDRTVGAIGLGAMPLSHAGRPTEREAFAVVHAALDAGVTLVDTADAYCLGPAEFGHNETVVARALRAYDGSTDDVVVATKAGHTRPSDDEWGLDGRPEYLKRAAEASLRRIGGDAIDLLHFHRPDPMVPWAESVGALRDLVDAGTIRMAGVSNADPEQIREAAAIVGPGLVSVQNELSPSFRTSLPELELCAELGLAFLPWSPLGASGAGRLAEDHPAFADVAAAHDATAQQVCLAWLLALGPHVVPIPGSSRPQTIRASAAAADIALTPDEVARLSGSG